MFKAVHPVLPSKDVSSAIDFYVRRLGFELLFQDVDPDSEEEPRYAGVGRDQVELHLQWHDPEEWSAVERPLLRFVVADVEALFEEYRSRDVFHSRTAIRDTPWGTREFAFYDGDSNGLTFYRDLTDADVGPPD